MQVVRDHLEQLPRVLLLETLSEEVLELHVGVFELFVEVGPRQVLIIDQVDEDVEGTLNIVPARLVKPTARVKGGEVEVAAELVELLLLDVASIFI